MKQEVVYIMGVGHSGSTLLQMLLSTHQDVVGIGEISLLIKNLLKSDSKINEWPQCSCGSKVTDCEFWADIIKSFNSSESDIKLYKHIIEHFSNKFPNKLLVDSSKNLLSFKKFYSSQLINDVDVKVIFLVRDFRSWVLSREKNNKRKKRKDYGMIFNAHKWYYRNIKKLNYLQNQKLSYITISYEDLVLNKVKTLNRLSKFLNLNGSTWDIGHATMHDVYGNRMKDKALKQFFYNNQWMKSSKMAYLAPFLVLPYSLNNKLYKQ